MQGWIQGEYTNPTGGVRMGPWQWMVFQRVVYPISRQPVRAVLAVINSALGTGKESHMSSLSPHLLFHFSSERMRNTITCVSTRGERVVSAKVQYKVRTCTHVPEAICCPYHTHEKECDQSVLQRYS